MKRCHNCGVTPSDDAFPFCQICGESFYEECATCLKPIPPYWLVCPWCRR